MYDDTILDWFAEHYSRVRLELALILIFWCCYFTLAAIFAIQEASDLRADLIGYWLFSNMKTLFQIISIVTGVLFVGACLKSPLPVLLAWIFTDIFAISVQWLGSIAEHIGVVLLAATFIGGFFNSLGRNVLHVFKKDLQDPFRMMNEGLLRFQALLTRLTDR